jgi:hypothetical protein
MSTLAENNLQVEMNSIREKLFHVKTRMAEFKAEETKCHNLCDEIIKKTETYKKIENFKFSLIATSYSYANKFNYT